MTSLRLLPMPNHEDSLGTGILTCERGLLPLVAMSVDAHLSGLVAATVVCQRFKNSYQQPLEATYIFPLPGRAAVTGFSVQVAGRHLRGALQERQAARQSYDQALAAGQRAAIMEEERPQVFTVRVGNLAPGDEAEVRLDLAGPVACEFGEAEFRLPLVVAPKYIPGHSLGTNVGDGVAVDTDAVPDASRISPPLLAPGYLNPVQLQLTAHLDPSGMVAGSLSSSHAAVVDDPVEPDDQLTVRLSDAQGGQRLDRDFVLRYRVSDDDQRAHGSLRVIAVADAASTGEGTVVVTIVPPQRPQATPARDVVLVLDRSGSMGGWKIVAARRAAARIVDSLTSADRFAVLAFDTVVEQPPGLGGVALVEASERNRYRAVEWLGRLEARGGTEMVSPLSSAASLLGASRSQHRTASCVLVTDGQVGNEDQLVRLVSGGDARVYTVGIDQSVNGGLLERLAEATGGRCELVESEDRLDQVLADLQRRIGHPVLEAASLSFDQLAVDRATLTPPGPLDVFPGVPVVVTGRYHGRAAGSAVLHSADGAELCAAVSPLPGGQALLSGAAGALWARSYLRLLEDRYISLPPTQSPAREQLAQQIVSISLAQRVLCRFTAWVAVDPSGEVIAGPLRQVVQPVESPAGWVGAGGQAAVLMSATRAMTGAPAAPMAPMEPMGAAPPPGSSPMAGHLKFARREPLTPFAAPGDAAFVPKSHPQRLEELLDEVDGLAPSPSQPLAASPALTRIATDLRMLLQDLVTAGRPADTGLVPLIDQLAHALEHLDMSTAHRLVKQIRDLPDAWVTGASHRRVLFWR